MCLRATIFRPLRSKRATISPVRPRANASGLTRIRVLSTKNSFRLGELAALARAFALGVARGFGGDRRLVRGRGAAAAPAGGLRRGLALHLGLAVRAQLPGRGDRLGARVAAVLELAAAARTAEVVRLDLVVAVRAQLVVELREARLGGGHLQLAQAHVVHELRGAHDQVDDRPDERE